MKKFSKYAVLLAILAFVPVCANAEVTVKETTSPEFIQNQGYSTEVSRIIEVKTKNLATPISTEKPSKWKRFGWYVMETLDPAVDRPGKFVEHNIQYGPSLEDL